MSKNYKSLKNLSETKRRQIRRLLYDEKRSILSGENYSQDEEMVFENSQDLDEKYNSSIVST